MSPPMPAEDGVACGWIRLLRQIVGTLPNASSYLMGAVVAEVSILLLLGAHPKVCMLEQTDSIDSSHRSSKVERSTPEAFAKVVHVNSVSWRRRK